MDPRRSWYVWHVEKNVSYFLSSKWPDHVGPHAEKPQLDWSTSQRNHTLHHHVSRYIHFFSHSVCDCVILRPRNGVLYAIC